MGNVFIIFDKYSIVARVIPTVILLFPIILMFNFIFFLQLAMLPINIFKKHQIN